MKSDFLKEWYDRFHNPRKKVAKRVGDKGQDEKIALNHYRNGERA